MYRQPWYVISSKRRTRSRTNRSDIDVAKSLGCANTLRCRFKEAYAHILQLTTLDNCSLGPLVSVNKRVHFSFITAPFRLLTSPTTDRPSITVQRSISSSTLQIDSISPHGLTRNYSPGACRNRSRTRTGYLMVLIPRTIGQPATTGARRGGRLGNDGWLVNTTAFSFVFIDVRPANMYV